ncbi:MAG: hypothetical protein ACE5DO_03025 [Desulfobacterales bacterium]
MATYKHDHTHITTPEPEKLIEFYPNVAKVEDAADPRRPRVQL